MSRQANPNALPIAIVCMPTGKALRWPLPTRVRLQTLDAGTVVSRVQVDSHVAIRYDDVMTREDNYLFCKAKGAGENFRLYGRRGTELASSMTSTMAHLFAWSDG